jgi:hypothetical protein
VAVVKDFDTHELEWWLGEVTNVGDNKSRDDHVAGLTVRVIFECEQQMCIGKDTLRPGVYIYMQIHVHIYTYIYVYVCVCVCVCVYVYVYIYICMCMYI